MITQRRPKRRSETKAPSRLAVSGTIVLLGVLAFVAFGVRSVNGVPGKGYQHLYANIPDIGNLRPHDEVRVAGVRVGQVLGETIDHGRAHLKVQLEPATGRLPADTQVVVRARGLLGSRYLELVPGTSSRMLPDGATITARPEVSLTNGVADVLDTFDRETRGRLGDMLGGLGQGLAGRGDGLNNLIRIGPGVTDQLTRVADAIEARTGAAAAFVPSVERGMSALDGARDDITGFFGAGARGMRPFIEARDATRATLTEAPPTLTAMQSGLGAGRSLLTATRSLAGALNRTLPEAPGALRRTTAMLRQSPTPLKRTATLLDAAKPAVPAVLQITGALSPNLVPLRRAFDDLDPLLDSLGEHSCDVTNFGDNWRSVLGYGMLNQRDLPGGPAGRFNQLRVNLVAGPQSLGSLAPGISRPFVHNRTVYEPACTHSPGPRYTSLGVGVPGTGGGGR